MKVICCPYLRFDQDQVDEQYDIIMLDVFVCEPLAPRALHESHVAAHAARARLLRFCLSLIMLLLL